MKKLFYIFFIFFGFSALNISQATSGCYIVWSGSQSGSTPTNATSKTERAAQELYSNLVFSECPYVDVHPSSNGHGCYGYEEYEPIECWKWVCRNGDWYAGVACYLKPQCMYMNYTASGTWNVICDINLCAAEAIYGENSEQTELLREYRDNVLSKTPEGQEIIKNYYIFSPTVTKLLEQIPLLKNRVKAFIDSMLPAIREKVEESQSKNR